MKVWIDHDGCPRIVRDIVTAGASRRSICVIVVGNSRPNLSPNNLLSIVCVPGGFDAADDHIADHVAPGDLVITSDVPLAARVVAKGAIAINSHGVLFDTRSIGEQLAARNLMQELRSGGMVSGGPPPFGPAEKKKFADAFDRTIEKLSRARLQYPR